MINLIHCYRKQFKLYLIQMLITNLTLMVPPQTAKKKKQYSLKQKRA